MTTNGGEIEAPVRRVPEYEATITYVPTVPSTSVQSATYGGVGVSGMSWHVGMGTPFSVKLTVPVGTTGEDTVATSVTGVPTVTAEALPVSVVVVGTGRSDRPKAWPMLPPPVPENVSWATAW